MKVTYKLNGKVVARKIFMRRAKGLSDGSPMIGHPVGWPLRSLGMGVPRSQVAEFNQMYADAGITGAHHEPDGTCVFNTRATRRAIGRLRGIRDNDAGYGDFAGKH